MFGEEVQITRSEEVEKSLERLANLHNLYNDMTKVLTQYLNALKHLIQAEDLLAKFFAEAGIHELDTSLRADFTAYGEQHRHFSKVTQELAASEQTFQDHVSTFFNKAIEDCFLTARKHDSARVEFDAFKSKLATLEHEATKGSNQKVSI